MIKVEENYATEFYYLSFVEILGTKKHRKVEKSDGHVSTTKKYNKILWRNYLPLNFIIDQQKQTNSLSISKCSRRYILANA